MHRLILGFTRLLRANGLRVSLSEHMDALQALNAIDIGDRETFRDALRGAMVKRACDIPIFDKLFEIHFSGAAEILRAAVRRWDSAGDDADLVNRLRHLCSGSDIELSELARAMLSRDPARLQSLLRAAMHRASARQTERAYHEDPRSRAAADERGFGALVEEFQQLKHRLGSAGIDADLAPRADALLDERLKAMRTVVAYALRSETERRDLLLRERGTFSNLADKSFCYLSEDDMQRMKDAVARLARRLKDVVAIRRRVAKRGKFDVQSTLRSNLQYGGVPFHVKFDRRARDKPKVVILCDVSDSVRNVSRFMLQFVYSLQDLYSRVRSFIFVSELAEVTHIFDECGVNEAIERVLSGHLVNIFAHSNFGKAFQAFHHNYLGIIDRRTTVIILGDARNNYNAPHEWVLEDIRKRAKRLAWLNPESRVTWGFGDSEMNRYLVHCDLAEECRNLNQLYRVIGRLSR